VQRQKTIFNKDLGNNFIVTFQCRPRRGAFPQGFGKVAPKKPAQGTLKNLLRKKHEEYLRHYNIRKRFDEWGSIPKINWHAHYEVASVEEKVVN